VHALTEPRRRLELVCFLRITLLHSTDVVLSMADRLIQDLHARTTQDVQEAEGRGARSVRQSLPAMHRVLSDPTIPDGRLRQALLALMPAAHMFFPSRAAAIRGPLSEQARHVRPLVKLLVGLAFEGEAHTPLLTALSRLRGLYARRARQLPDDIDASVAPRRAELIGGVDRQRALQAFEAATLLARRKALRSGAVWVAHSLAYGRRNAMLIPDVEGEHQRQRWYQHLSLPLQASRYTPQLLATLEAGLTSLAEAVEAGEVSVDDQGVHLQALEAEEVPADLEATTQALFNEVGVVQLPTLLMAIDHETRFSWRLLGHAPTTDRELLTVYAALRAHGTELDAAGMALMMPALSEAAIAEAMPRLEDEAVWRAANALVLEFWHRHAVVQVWGEGTFAAADAMRLEASRHLWNARVDPMHKAGSALGKLWRILFLCDYLSNSVFRREVLRILNHGESVHTLQRVIHFGSIAAARGRCQAELVAISGALTLLANIVMAWMTQHIQRLLDAWHHAGARHVEGDQRRHMAPVHVQGINLRGVLQFPVARYRHRLILETPARARQRAHATTRDAHPSQETIDAAGESDATERSLVDFTCP
jgi:hypothetical protein